MRFSKSDADSRVMFSRITGEIYFNYIMTSGFDDASAIAARGIHIYSKLFNICFAAHHKHDKLKCFKIKILAVAKLVLTESTKKKWKHASLE